MKYINKMMSIVSLLIVASAYCAQEPGQLITFHITNNTGKVIYGNIYKTNLIGTVVDERDQKQYYPIKDGQCLTKHIHKSLNRTSEYHRLIFSHNPYSLREAVLDNKIKLDVQSELIKQSLKQTHQPGTECYTIRGSKLRPSKLSIKRVSSGTKCPACTGEAIPASELDNVATAVPSQGEMIVIPAQR